MGGDSSTTSAFRRTEEIAWPEGLPMDQKACRWKRSSDRLIVRVRSTVNVYPMQYHLDQLTAHLVALLERRRAAIEAWNDEAECSLLEEAKRALDEAGRQFKEVADDEAYWGRTTEQLMTVAMPRYLVAAKAEHELERRKYGVWRGGDLLSRVVYAVGGLLVGVLIIRTAIPDWLEPIPLAFFVGGPLLPDLQVWLARRRYRKQLKALIDDMRDEAADTSAYQPLGIDQGAGVGETPTATSERAREQH